MKRLLHLLLPLVGVGLALLAWWGASLKVTDLPSPVRTWEESKLYVLEPFAKKEQADAKVMVEDAADAVVALIRDGLNSAQEQFNRGPRR